MGYRGELMSCQESQDALEAHFKVPFTAVLDLVSKRSVFLRAGYAFVPTSSVSSLLQHQFRSDLLDSRPIAQLALSKMRDDERFTRLIDHISCVLRNKLDCEATVNLPTSIVLKMSDLPDIARQSFPLCMLSYHERVMNKSRIDHSGWLQYSGFLKDIGAKVEHVAQYWEGYYKALGRSAAELAKKKYDLRHVYGLEGHRKALKPFSCKSIVLSTDDVHGCPFRSSSVEGLTARLDQLGLSSTDKSDLSSIDTQNHCQLACARVFNAVHRCRDRPTSVNRPAGYFVDSRLYREDHPEEFVNWDEEMVIP